MIQRLYDIILHDIEGRKCGYSYVGRCAAAKDLHPRNFARVCLLMVTMADEWSKTNEGSPDYRASELLSTAKDVAAYYNNHIKEQ